MTRPESEDPSTLWEELAQPAGGTIVYLVLDGLGGLSDPERGGSELELAKTPNLDALARASACGLVEIVAPGVTPGSGPGHLALFGYEPRRFLVGRGVLAALGIDFELREGDVAARINFATIDDDGKVTDRRAGRIATEANRRLCRKLLDAVDLDFEGEWFLETVSEHRAVLVLRGEGLGGNVADTDPQATGRAPRPPQATSEDSEKTARLVGSFVERCRQVLSEEPRANMVLLRGFERHHALPSLEARFRLKAVCLADYPMYRGLSRLLGMEVVDPPGGLDAQVSLLSKRLKDADFFFLHEKGTDKAGEDGDFEAKVRSLEAVDEIVPRLREIDPDVLIVTGDHSTPSVMAAHSWHPVPVLLRARLARVDDVDSFNELACGRGALGRRPAVDLMGLALAHAERLIKYGA